MEPSALLLLLVVNHRTHYHSRGWNWKREEKKQKNVCYIKTKKKTTKQAGESPCVPIGSFFVSLHTVRILQLTGFFSVRHLHGDMWEIFFLRLMCRSFLSRIHWMYVLSLAKSSTPRAALFVALFFTSPWSEAIFWHFFPHGDQFWEEGEGDGIMGFLCCRGKSNLWFLWRK